jgi:ABC-type spermidine/putrescine transport system permease subunit II
LPILPPVIFTVLYSRSLSENLLRRSYFGIVVAHGVDTSPLILFGWAKAR